MTTNPFVARIDALDPQTGTLTWRQGPIEWDGAVCLAYNNGDEIVFTEDELSTLVTVIAWSGTAERCVPNYTPFHNSEIIVDWNDHRDTTLADVFAILAEASTYVSTTE